MLNADTLIKVRKTIPALIGQDADFEDIMATELTSDWDAARGNGAVFINRVYQSLAYHLDGH